jgi:hypothetical protein
VRFDRLEVHWSFHNIVVIRCLGRFDRVVEDVAITMLRNLRMNHGDDRLEFLGRLRVGRGWATTSARGTYSRLKK